MVLLSAAAYIFMIPLSSYINQKEDYSLEPELQKAGIQGILDTEEHFPKPCIRSRNNLNEFTDTFHTFDAQMDEIKDINKLG